MRYLISILVLFAIACGKEQYEEELPCSEDNIICLYSDTTTRISANGLDTVRFTAYLPKDANDTIEKITFKVPADSGIKSLENDSNSVVKALDINKSAAATFRAGYKKGIFPVHACVTFNGEEYCSNTVLVEVMSSGEITIESTPNKDLGGLFADGISSLRIDTKVEGFSNEDNSLKVDILGPVTFEGATGKEMKITLDAQGKATTNLNFSDQYGEVTVGFDYNGIREIIDFVIQPAIPDDMVLASDSTSISPLSTIPIKIYLDKDVGNFSQDIPIRLEAFQDGLSGSIGQFDPPFLQTSTDVSGSPNTEVMFRLNDVSGLDENLPIIFRGRVGFDGDEVISEPLTVNIKL